MVGGWMAVSGDMVVHRRGDGSELGLEEKEVKVKGG